MDALRLCFRYRKGDLWLADMTHPTIDFTVSNGTDLDEEMTTLLKQPYNEHDGPMWKTQLIICPQDAPCNVPHIKKHFPYQYHFQFTTNHAVHDGLTQLVVVQCIFNILDDLLEGVRVNDEPFGQLRDRTEARQVEDTIRAELEKDPKQIESLLMDHMQRETTPLITQAFGVPEEPNPETHCMKSHVIDPYVMQRFNKHCRSLGVTLNSGFLGVLNTALVEVVREAGLEMDQYTISNAHPVNCSRLVREPGLHLGFHALPMTLTMVTPCDVRANFWGYVKQVDTEFRKKLRENYMIKERVLDKMLRQYGYSSDTDPYPLKYNYLVANIYSPTVKIFGIGRHLQLTDLINHVGFTNQNYAILQGLGSMRDQVRYQLMYSSRRVTKRNAEKLSNKAIDVLYDITRMLN